MIDISGKVLKEITTRIDPKDMCVHQSGDIYCTVWNCDSVYVVTPKEKETEFYSNPELSGALGIAVNNKGYIYVAGEYSNNIHRISQDGKDHYTD